MGTGTKTRPIPRFRTYKKGSADFADAIKKEIARVARVSPHTVAEMKSALTLQTQGEPLAVKFTNKRGTFPAPSRAYARG